MPLVQNFVDGMNIAETELSELVNFAEALASRLVGYADTPESAYPGDMPSSGILPEMADRANRMSRKVGDVRRSLNRIVEALPSDTIASATKDYR